MLPPFLCPVNKTHQRQWRIRFGFETLLPENSEMVAERKGMKKRMGCKAHGEVKYRSNLMVVRILTSRATRQTAFSSPRHNKA